MTTTDAAALLRAVLRDPAEDTPRLMYADELEEAGERDRAELIRWQVGGGRDFSWHVGWDCEPACPQLSRALDRILAGPICPRFVVSRGLVRSVAMPCRQFLEDAAALFAAHPITEVVLTDKEPLSDGGVGTYFGRPPGSPQNWYWLTGGSRSSLAWELPPDLGHPTENTFASEDAADEWLSRRCVAYGRKLAGLEPLQ